MTLKERVSSAVSTEPAIRELNHPLVLADVELPQQLLYGQVLVVFITVECALGQIIRGKLY